MTGSADTAADRARLKREIIVGTVFVTAMFMTVMDITVVNVSVPTIARDFHAPASSVQWVATGYLLSLAIFIPASGWIGDRFGARRVLLTAIAIFAAGSAWCAASGSMTELTLARVLQGMGGGMMQPVGMALLFRTFPPERRARASQILIIPTAVAPAVGPIVGGILVQDASWRWVFLINIPVAAAAFTFGAIFLPHEPQPDAGRFDVAGFLLAGPGLALILYGVSQGPVAGWGQPRVGGSVVLGLLLIGILVNVELRSPSPMLDFRLFKDRLFLDCTLVGIVGFGAFLGTLFIVPIYLQEARGFSPLASGLATFPEALGVLVSTQAAGRLYPRVGPRRLQIGGLTVFAAVLLAGAMIFGPETSLWVVRLFMFGMGTGLAYVLISQQAARFATISPAATGRATALAAAIQQASAATAIAVLTTVLASQVQHGAAPTPQDFRPVFLIAAAMAVVGGLFALRIRDADAAVTMHRPSETYVEAAQPVELVEPPAPAG
jgi:EmrB/QacA subfamily drug resistance transporter